MSDNNANNIFSLSANMPHVTKDSMMAIKSVGKEDSFSHTLKSPDLPQKKHQTCLQKFNHIFTRLLYCLGENIATFPSYFILIPVFVSFVALTGLQLQVVEKDFETLWYPTGGRAPYERSVIEEYFPINYDTFIPYHTTRLEGFTRVLMESLDGGTVFRSDVFSEMQQLDSLIMNITISDSEQVYSYYDICAKYHGECFTNEVFGLGPYIPEIENGSMHVNYPVMFVPMIVPMYFGGLKIDDEGLYIESAEAIATSYFLRLDSNNDRRRARLWEAKFLNTLQQMEFQYINVSQATSTSVIDETSKLTDGIGYTIPYLAMVMSIYTIVSVMTSDWVRSKPFVGLIGMAVSALGTFTTFGILAYLGIPTSGLNDAIPFLMLGIGLDDMFVVLSAWSRTDIQASVRQRLGETYAEAGVSITITSLTNIVSFSMGLLTPVPTVRLFCLYTASSLFILYLWHMTLFGACLAVAGYLEKDQRHSIICMRVSSKSEAEKQGHNTYKIWCAGGINEYDPRNPKDNADPVVMAFFRDTIGNWLIQWKSKCVLLALYFLYLGGAIYGCTAMKEGLDRFKMVPHDSYAAKFFQIEDELFRKFPYNIQVVITGDLEYSEPKTKEMIMKLHGQMEDLPFIFKGIFTQSYIRSWYRYLQRKKKIADTIHNETDFVAALKARVDRDKNNRRSLDIAFNEDSTKISAVRFILQAYEVNTTNDDRDMMLMLRDVAANFTDLNVTVFNPNFILFEQYGGVRQSVIQATLIAAASMIVISLIFIPNAMCSVVVGFSIISIELGVIGFMSLWEVNLDPMSTITLIMCIGFSVDFTAHISYAYLASKAKTPQDKLKECLYCLGLPIIQGAASTILCVITFAFIPSYAYTSFFKMVLIVITAATIHGILFIPALLTLFDVKLNKNEEETPDNGDPIIISIKSLLPATEPMKIPRVSITTNSAPIEIEPCSDDASDTTMTSDGKDSSDES